MDQHIKGARETEVIDGLLARERTQLCAVLWHLVQQRAVARAMARFRRRVAEVQQGEGKETHD